MRTKNFKQIVQLIADIEKKEDINTVCGEIEKSFQAEKISWNEHETLYKLASKVAKAI